MLSSFNINSRVANRDVLIYRVIDIDTIRMCVCVCELKKSILNKNVLLLQDEGEVTAAVWRSRR